MQTLNILIAGDGKFCDEIKKSKYLEKLYVTSEAEIEGTVNVKFNTFRGLAQKCKSLQIDLVIAENEQYILEGIADVMKKYFVNCIAVTSDWTNLKLKNSYRNSMLTKYGIDIPPKVILPVDFPIIVKTDSFEKEADTIQEIIDIKQEIYDTMPEIAKTVYLEKYPEGEKYTIYSLFDGKHLLTLPNKNINELTLKEYSVNVEHMLVSEKADFTGFINSHVIYANEKLYNIGFGFEPIIADNIDMLYLLYSAIYQKLDEIELLV